MVKFQVYRETVTERGEVVEAGGVETWLDVSDVFSVQADDDPAWSVLTFKPGCGPRHLVVHGTAETVAAVIGRGYRPSREVCRRLQISRTLDTCALKGQILNPRAYPLV